MALRTASLLLNDLDGLEARLQLLLMVVVNQAHHDVLLLLRGVAGVRLGHPLLLHDFILLELNCGKRAAEQLLLLLLDTGLIFLFL